MSTRAKAFEGIYNDYRHGTGGYYYGWLLLRVASVSYFTWGPQSETHFVMYFTWGPDRPHVKYITKWLPDCGPHVKYDTEWLLLRAAITTGAYYYYCCYYRGRSQGEDGS